MGLFRFLILIFVALIAARWLLRMLAPKAQPPRPPEQYLPLVPCKICGAHIPQSADGSAAVCERCRTR